jgi:aryl-alcohol dehydrogenase-like predicted oxidoreductase
LWKRIGAAAERGLTGFCASQIGWSLAQVNPAVRGAAKHGSNGWTKRCAGTGKAAFLKSLIHRRPTASSPHRYPTEDSEMTAKQKKLAPSYLNDQTAARHERAAELAATLGRTTNEVALAYVWSQSFPSIAIIGPRNMQQFTDSISAVDLRLTPQQVTFLEAT